MKAYALLTILLLTSISAYATYDLTPIPTDFKLSYESARRNDGNENLGLFGANMNFDVYKGFYLGPSLYGAMQGDLGGLFVIGGNAGYKYNIVDGLWIDTGYFVGGGGGHNDNNNDPSGFISRSHIGLSYNFKYFELGIEYADINYPDYAINSTQWAFTFSIPGTLLTGNPAYLGTTTTSLSDIFSNRGLNFYRTFIGMYQENYFLNNSTDPNGEELNDTMRLVGAKGGVFLNRNIYFGISTAGAYDSSKNGYMDFYTLLGYQYYFTRQFFYDIEGAIGAGGGGNTDTGSGFIYKPSAGLGYALTPALILQLNGGYINAPSGNFEGYFAEIGLYYQFYNAGPETFSSDFGNGQYEFAGWRVSGQNETYMNPQRSNSSHEVENINLAVIEISKLVNDTIYIEGQAASAYAGNAGSYSSGMLGLGAQTPTWQHFRVMGNVLAGAAGGGGMDVGQGAIYQPEIGVSFDVTPYISLIAKTGRVMSFDGGLNAQTYNAGIVFNFTTLEEGI